MQHNKKRIAISTDPTTQPVAESISAILAQGHLDCEFFPLDEFELVGLSGRFDGVIHLTLAALVSDLFQISASHSNRLTVGAQAGLSQVIVPGDCDVVVTSEGSRSITPKEVERLAKDIAQKASASRGLTSIVVPTQSWSMTTSVDSEVNRVFVETLHLWLSPAVRLHTMACRLSDSELADRTAQELLCLISATRGSG